MNRTSFLFVFIIGILLLNACSLGAAPPAVPTPDLAVVRTEAAMTVIADFTAMAPLASPTLAFTATQEGSTTQGTPVLEPTTAPANTATPGPCDDYVYIADVNYPDNTIMAPGQDFLKTWRIKNTGACTWGAGYAVVYADYAYKMDGQPAALDRVVQQGEEIEVSVQFTAPTEPGEYLSAWTLVNPAGTPFGKGFFVRIIVE
jgi:hypothetical protein